MFSSAVTVTEASPVPDVIDNDSQVSLEAIVHDWFDTIVNVLLPPSDAKDKDVGLTLKVGVAPFCVT